MYDYEKKMALSQRAMRFAKSQVGLGNSLAMNAIYCIVASSYEAGAMEQEAFMLRSDSNARWDPKKSDWSDECY